MSDTLTIKERVLNALNKIRPYLQADGGDIELLEITDDMSVRVKLTGACHGCPYSMMTLKAGVEKAVRQDVPEIKQVISA
ncbi:MAG TPA: NifU family protein [Bacteroidales bacterium]|jgi:Fe-S cluster biogenesis protein NfuA|nr:NifU family protein [Bacteroidales bacterium]HOS71130.1 NifU family protein [Bacteroidales bacterium]HQH23773.1 NifU family protein [Bacteroidales bacterium]HQJ81598.1 NifU family protein [Bacteroidales bacterium]